MSFQDADIFRMLSMYPEFVYRDKRLCSRTWLCFKMLGLGFYSTTTAMCIHDKMVVWFGMVSSIMVASICNTIRYEYAFFKIYGTTFPSVQAFIQWKTQHGTNVKHMLDFIELIVKVVYFGRSFPPRFNMYDEYDKFSICKLGITILNLNVLVIIVWWFMFALFLCTMYTHINMCAGESNANHEDNANHEGNEGNANHAIAIAPDAIVIDQDTECCICLDKNDNIWTTARCTHSFHEECMTKWKQQNPSCPVCRAELN